MRESEDGKEGIDIVGGWGKRGAGNWGCRGVGGVGGVVEGWWWWWWSRSHLHINYQAGAGGRF